jgi:hypothetical protein
MVAVSGRLGGLTQGRLATRRNLTVCGVYVHASFVSEDERLIELRMRIAQDLAQRASEAATIEDHGRYMEAFIRVSGQIRADIARAAGIAPDEDEDDEEPDVWP